MKTGKHARRRIEPGICGHAYVIGHTTTPEVGFPVTAGTLQSTSGGGFDAFVAKITTNVPFAAFRAKAEIDVRHRPHHNEFEARHGHHSLFQYEMGLKAERISNDQ